MTRTVVLDPITKTFSQNDEVQKGNKVKKVRQFNVVARDEETAYAYKRFCFNQDFKPTQLLTLFVNAYGEAQLLAEKVSNNEITPGEGLKGISSIIKNMEIVTQVNSQFRGLAKQVMKSRDINLDDLAL